MMKLEIRTDKTEFGFHSICTCYLSCSNTYFYKEKSYVIIANKNKLKEVQSYVESKLKKDVLNNVSLYLDNLINKGLREVEIYRDIKKQINTLLQK